MGNITKLCRGDRLRTPARGNKRDGGTVSRDEFLCMNRTFNAIAKRREPHDMIDIVSFKEFMGLPEEMSERLFRVCGPDIKTYMLSSRNFLRTFELAARGAPASEKLKFYLCHFIDLVEPDREQRNGSMSSRLTGKGTPRGDQQPDAKSRTGVNLTNRHTRRSHEWQGPLPSLVDSSSIRLNRDSVVAMLKYSYILCCCLHLNAVDEEPEADDEFFERQADILLSKYSRSSIGTDRASGTRKNRSASARSGGDTARTRTSQQDQDFVQVDLSQPFLTFEEIEKYVATEAKYLVAPFDMLLYDSVYVFGMSGHNQIGFSHAEFEKEDSTDTMALDERLANLDPSASRGVSAMFGANGLENGNKPEAKRDASGGMRATTPSRSPMRNASVADLRIPNGPASPTMLQSSPTRARANSCTTPGKGEALDLLTLGEAHKPLSSAEAQKRAVKREAQLDFYLPQMKDQSLLMSREEQWMLLASKLWSTPSYPPLIDEWSCLFKNTEDGTSFSTMMHKIRDYRGPLLFIFGTGDKRFGAYVSTPLYESQSFIGNEECFLFSLSNGVQVYSSIPGQKHWVYFNTSTRGVPWGLGFGGDLGKFRLWISNDLEHGETMTTSKVTDTYAFGLLNGFDESFIIDYCEVWGLGGEEILEEQKERTKRLERDKARWRRVDRRAFKWESEADVFVMNAAGHDIGTYGGLDERREQGKPPSVELKEVKSIESSQTIFV